MNIFLLCHHERLMIISFILDVNEEVNLKIQQLDWYMYLQALDWN